MKTVTLFLLLMGAQTAWANHLAGGYIQASATTGTGLTYDIKVVLYLNESLGATAADNLSAISLCFGDGTTGIVTRVSRIYIAGKEYSLNTYRITHTYAGSGTYTLATIINGRTTDQNIKTDVNQSFALTTTLTTNTTASNQTPTPGFPPTGFRVAVSQKATLALSATDPDGDSLVYGLAKPLVGNSSDPCGYGLINTYQFPNDLTRQGTFRLDSRTGILTWDAPALEGNYSVVITIDEYRNGVLISQTTQEISLLVDDKPGTPGTIPPYEPALQGPTTGLVTATTPYADSDFEFAAFPSPVDDFMQVTIQTSNPATAVIRLFGTNGQELYTLTFNRAARQHGQIIGMSSFTPGVYLIRADVGGRSLTRKIVKR